MKGKVLLMCVVLATLALIPAIQPVRADITSWTWINPTFSGLDDFYNAYVFAYKAGATAQLIVSVFHDYMPMRDKDIYIPEVKVGFDWGVKNWTSTEEDVKIPWRESRTFSISITVPTDVSTLVTHIYTVYADIRDAAGNRLDTWTKDWDEIPPYYPFAIYSSDQADAKDIKRELDAYPATIPTGKFGWTSAARELLIKATLEQTLGNDSYGKGAFADAKTHYGNALNYTRTAITEDVTKGASFEDSFISLIDSLKGQLTMQGYAFLIFSVGFLLIGIGAIIYLIRRSKPPATA